MGKWNIQVNWKHQSGENGSKRGLTKSQFDRLIKHLVNIGGAFNVDSTLEYID